MWRIVYSKYKHTARKNMTLFLVTTLYMWYYFGRFAVDRTLADVCVREPFIYFAGIAEDLERNRLFLCVFVFVCVYVIVYGSHSPLHLEDETVLSTLQLYTSPCNSFAIEYTYL